MVIFLLSILFHKISIHSLIFFDNIGIIEAHINFTK